MPSHALPRQAKFAVEATFIEEIDYSVAGTEIYVIEPDVSALDQQNIESENNRPRRTFVHDMIRSLKSGSEVPLGLYMTAAGATAAEAAQAVATPQSDIFKACLGGRNLGWSIGFSGGTAAAPEIDADPGYVVGDPIFAYDDSTGTGEFYIIEAIVGTVLTLDRDLHFVPDPADVAHAVISIYLDEDALNDHDDVDHTTLGWLVQGEDTDDVYVIRGCKPSLEIEGITAGEPVKAAITNMVTDWAPAPAAVAFPGPVSGIAPNVPGTGCDTIFRIAAIGSPLADVDARGTITPNLGVSWEAVTGPNGCEGVHGYVATGVGEGGPQVSVEYERAYQDGWFAETKYHMLTQVGATPSDAWGIYWPQLEYRVAPKRVAESEVTTHALDFRAQENPGSVAGLTGNDINQRRSPVLIMIVA
jgi:hypothetical protein